MVSPLKQLEKVMSATETQSNNFPIIILCRLHEKETRVIPNGDDGSLPYYIETSKDLPFGKKFSVILTKATTQQYDLIDRVYRAILKSKLS